MHWFIDPIKNHYFDFEGRASRKEFWMFALFTFLAGIITGIIDVIIGASVTNTLLLIAIIIPCIAISVRRLHDIGKTGWWLLLSFVPFIGSIILIIFYVLKGDEGTNKYGPNPYASETNPDSAAPEAVEPQSTPVTPDVAAPVEPETREDKEIEKEMEAVDAPETDEVSEKPEENKQQGYGG